MRPNLGLCTRGDSPEPQDIRPIRPRFEAAVHRLGETQSLQPATIAAHGLRGLEDQIEEEEGKKIWAKARAGKPAETQAETDMDLLAGPLEMEEIEPKKAQEAPISIESTEESRFTSWLDNREHVPNKEIEKYLRSLPEPLQEAAMTCLSDQDRDIRLEELSARVAGLMAGGHPRRDEEHR